MTMTDLSLRLLLPLLLTAAVAVAETPADAVSTAGEVSAEPSIPSPAAAGEPQSEEPEPVPMARVGDAVITVDDFMRFLSLNPDRINTVTSGLDGRAEVLRMLIANILLQQAMKREGLVAEGAEQADYFAAYEELAKKYFPAQEITDEAQLLAYYEANRDRYGIAAATRVSEIRLLVPPEADEAARAEVEERGRMILKRLDAGESFADLAREYSDNIKAREEGGDLGFIDRSIWGPWLVAALDGIGVGQYTGMLPSPDGFEILMVTDERKALIPPFAEVKSDVKRDIERDAQDARQLEYVKRLARETPIEIELEELKGAFADGIFP